MDPNFNLEQQLTRAKSILEDIDNGLHVFRVDAELLAEYVLSLDEWITKGGFLPERWTKKPEPESDLDIYFNK